MIIIIIIIVIVIIIIIIVIAIIIIIITQVLIWNLKVKFIGVVIGQGNTVSPVSNCFTSFLLASI